MKNMNREQRERARTKKNKLYELSRFSRVLRLDNYKGHSLFCSRFSFISRWKSQQTLPLNSMNREQRERYEQGETDYANFRGFRAFRG